MADRKTPEQIKSAVSEVLNQVVIGSKGGSIDGSLSITGDGNFVKAPDFFIGENSVSQMIQNAGVKTVNGQKPDTAGNINIDAGVTSVNGHSGAVTQEQLGCLPLTGGTLTGNVTLSGSPTQICKEGTATNWVFGRNYAVVKQTSHGGDGNYSCFASIKTGNGSWDIGAYNQNKMYVTYITDDNYNAGTNTITTQFEFRTNGELSMPGWCFAAGHKATSDARLKENISKVHYDLSSISTYHYKLKTDGENHVGLLAQEVEKVIPEAVSEDKKGFKHLDYNAVVSALVSEVNLLKEEVAKLKARK